MSLKSVSTTKFQLGGDTIILYCVLIVLSVLFLFPFFWTVSSSLKEVWELYNFPPTWLPASPQWGNYARVVEKVPFFLWAWNSVLVVILTTAGTILSASVVAYSFARFRYRGRGMLFSDDLGHIDVAARR